MSNNNFNTIKLDCDLKKPALAAIDLTTKNPVEFWLFNNLKFCITLLNNGALFAFDNVTKVILGVKPCDSSGYPLDTQNFDILKEVAVANISTTLSAEEYAAGSSHFEAEILPADISTQMQSGVKWVIVQVVNTDGSKLTFFAGNANCKNDAADGFATGENLSQIKGYLETAQTAATNAATSASNAAQSATTAEQEATAASVARDDAYLAQIGAENAKDTAVEANTQAQAAKQAAIDAANTATQAAGIQAIRQEMLTKGYLHCTAGGYATGGFTGADILSVIFKTNADFSSVADDNVLSFFLLGVYQNGFDMQLGDDHVCRLKRNSNGFKSFSQTAIAAKATNEINIICAVFKKLEDGNADGTLYVNGNVISPISTKEGVYPTFGNKYYVNNVSGTQGGRTKTYIGYQDFMIFNFDIFTENAPYTYTDYANGNLVPLALKDTTATNRALLMLENYTILNGSSRFIPDVSGNGQDATVGTFYDGTISGDADISIAKFKEYFTANS